MCGIAGEFAFDSTGRIDPSLAPPLAAALRHRGPDQWGYHVGRGGSALLVSTRLSIVDLSHGRQPIPNEDGTIWVVFNGEIYGFGSIARDLERRGHVFRTRSDTEVIVHLYEEHGEDLVEHLRGEFAFALLDERRDRLLLGRDRFGIKPLFYSAIPGSLIFASEVKALFRHPGIARRLNRAHVYRTLHGLLLPGETYFDNVHEVEPGFVLTVSPAGITRRRYWDLPLVPDDRAFMKEEAAVEEFRRLFYESVRLRLHGDVEVGVFLSGGLDSTSVAAAATEISGRPMKAFTIAFANEGFDESPAARRMAAEIGVEHHCVRIGPGDLGPGFERSLWHSEIVVGNSHGVAKLLLADLARRHVKVVLTGEGADEALAGYNVFRHLLLLEAARRTPGDPRLRAELRSFVKRLGLHSGVLPVRAYSDYDRITALFGCYPYAMARAVKIGRAARRILSKEFRRSVSGLDPIAEMAAHIGKERLAGLDPVSVHQYYAFKTDLAGYILVGLGDRVEMAHSIEGRVPFLDHKLVEFTCALPQSLKLRNDSGKYLLREAMRHRIPSAPDIRKRPFMAPSAETFGMGREGNALDSYLDARVVREVGIFDPLAIGALRRCLGWLPRRSYAHGIAESLLTVVASVHALHGLFCARYEESLARFTRAPETLDASHGARAAWGEDGSVDGAAIPGGPRHAPQGHERWTG
jgi:asparagine synthase (glutamine-hydrolysing)